MAGGIGALGNLLGKVNANGALVVALDGGTASATKFLAGDGSASAPSYSFASEAGTGLFRLASGHVVFTQSNTETVSLYSSGLKLRSVGTLEWSSTTSSSGAGDVSLSRGAANRLDLATGDSFYVVSGAVGIGAVPGSTGLTVSAGADLTWSGRAVIQSPAASALTLVDSATTGPASLGLGPTASATSARKLIKKVTGIADAAATDVITVTVPNANHAATIQLTFLSSNGSTDAFESSRTAEGAVVLARTTGVATVAVVATLELAQIATVAAGATHTLAYGVSAMTGAVGATQTFTIQVTINDSGNVGSNQVVVMAELINAEATGVTIA